MNNKVIFGLVFIFNYGIQVCCAGFLNMGSSELIALLIVGILFFAFFFGIFFLIYFLIKKSRDHQSAIIASSVAINFSQPDHYQTKCVEENEEKTIIKATANIALPQHNETRYVDPQDVVRCEADNNYTNFILIGDEKLLISKSLKEYTDLLKPFGFVRSHQSHLVNPKFVKSWLKEDGGTLLMKNGDKIPVSKPNRDAVKIILGK
ncbi:LytTR family DNA-binding domain-containing protein [Pedobacter sp. Leaf41]|uniref:LytR/AlgR family response regulator transcription factor n=1 Tax=Pedobacter sp. Leaf41 TaxID=1736218 RepID=UPI0009E69F49|nr:LytTR family DNA-binding domain-containing protein [Pedobacter sp. Leaf41]